MQTTITDSQICWAYKDPPDPIEIVFEDELALAYFLAENIILLMANTKTITLAVNCSDIFYWGSADAEFISPEELDTLWQYYTKDSTWGPSIWCITKRKMLPQKPVYDAIQKTTNWNLDEIKNLQFNPTWSKP